MAPVPVELLTSKSLQYCGYALYVRKNKHIPTGDAASILYDYCLENGVKKLASPDILYRIDPNRTYPHPEDDGAEMMASISHEWVVRLTITHLEQMRKLTIQKPIIQLGYQWLGGDRASAFRDLARWETIFDRASYQYRTPEEPMSRGVIAETQRAVRHNLQAHLCIMSIRDPHGFMFLARKPRERMGYRLLAALGARGLLPPVTTGLRQV